MGTVGCNRDWYYLLNGEIIVVKKLSEARIKANKKWDEKNKERKKYIVKRSTAKGFIRDYATDDDLTELLTLISDRLELLHEKNRTNNK